MTRRLRPGTEVKNGDDVRRVIRIVAREDSLALCVVFESVPTQTTHIASLESWATSPLVHLPDGDTWKDRPKPGERYRHFKGNCYAVVTNAVSPQGQHFVIYRGEDGTAWARLALSWFASVNGSPRFSRLK